MRPPSLRPALVALAFAIVVLLLGVARGDADDTSGGPTAAPLVHHTPRDVVYDSVFRVALELRQLEDDPGREGGAGGDTWPPPPTDPGVGTRDAFGLTLMGSKAGYYARNPDPEAEVNQDRAFTATTAADGAPPLTAVGVLDGHGHTGHYVSELGRRGILHHLEQFYKDRMTSTDTMTSDNMTDFWTQALHRIDASLPLDLGRQGGATVSLGLFLGNDTFVAVNAGDSQTVLAAAIRAPSGAADAPRFVTLFVTRADKPTDPAERARILRDHPAARLQEASAADVARVWSPGGPGLAMTRALGDAQAEAVIATPVVTVLPLAEARWPERACAVTDSGDADCPAAGDDFGADHVDFFMFSATDGILDEFETVELTKRVGAVLYGTSAHPFVALRDLMLECKERWRRASPRYRDDMAIAVARLIR